MITIDPACESRVWIRNGNNVIDIVDMSELEDDAYIVIKEIGSTDRNVSFNIVYSGSLSSLIKILKEPKNA